MEKKQISLYEIQVCGVTPLYPATDENNQHELRSAKTKFFAMTIFVLLDCFEADYSDFVIFGGSSDNRFFLFVPNTLSFINGARPDLKHGKLFINADCV